jgi:hypothetical protein
MGQIVEGMKRSIPAHLLAGVNRGARDITDTLLSAVGGAPAEAAEAKAKAEYEQRYGQSPLASSARLGTQMAVTAPVGGLVAAPLTALATKAPALANVLTPVATALRTSGFGQTGVTGAANLGARAIGGAVPGAISAGLINPDDIGMGAAIGAAIPAAVVPFVKGAIGVGKSLAAGPGQLKYKGLAAALDNNPVLMGEVMDLLKQGKTIQEAAVITGTPGLASFFSTAVNKSSESQRMVNALRDALKAQQANQLAGAEIASPGRRTRKRLSLRLNRLTSRVLSTRPRRLDKTCCRCWRQTRCQAN